MSTVNEYADLLDSELNQPQKKMKTEEQSTSVETLVAENQTEKNKHESCIDSKEAFVEGDQEDAISKRSSRSSLSEALDKLKIYLENPK